MSADARTITGIRQRLEDRIHSLEWQAGLAAEIGLGYEPESDERRRAVEKEWVYRAIARDLCGDLGWLDWVAQHPEVAA